MAADGITERKQPSLTTVAAPTANATISQKILAWLADISAVLAWASMGSFFVMMSNVRPMMRGVFRAELTTLTLLPFAILQYYFESRSGKQVINLPTKDLKRKCISAIVAAGTLSALFNATWIVSFSYTSLAHAYIFCSVHPILIAIGMRMLGKKLSLYEFIAVIVGVIGVCITLMDLVSVEQADVGVAPSVFGDFLAFTSNFCFIGFLFLVRYSRSFGIPLFVCLLPIFFVSSIVSAIIAMALQGATLSMDPVNGIFGWLNPDSTTVMVLLAASCLVGGTAYVFALKYLNALLVAMTMLLEAPAAVPIGILLGTQAIPSAWTVIGGLILVLSLVGMQLAESRRLAAEKALTPAEEASEVGAIAMHGEDFDVVHDMGEGILDVKESEAYYMSQQEEKNGVTVEEV